MGKSWKFLCLILFAFLSVGMAAQTAGKATVVFYRMTHATGVVGIWIDGKESLNLDYRRRMVLKIIPGKHEFRSNDENNSLVIALEPGETCYIREEYGYGKWIERKVLTQVSEDIGRKQNLKTKSGDATYLVDRALAPDLEFR